MSLRILHIMPCRFLGGPEKQMLQVASALRERYGHDSIFAIMPHWETPPEQNPLIVEARDKGFEALPFLMRHNYSIGEGISVLRSFVRHYQPDIVCTIGYKANLFSALGADKPKIAVVHGWTSQNWKVRVYEWLDKRTLHRHSAVIVVSKAQSPLVRRLGVADEAIYWAPNAIDTHSLTPSLERIELLSAFETEPVYLIGSVGRLSPEKGHRYLVAAIAIICSQIPAIGTVLIGDGNEMSNLQEQVRRAGLQNSVKFWGFIADAQRIIGALDLMILPSLTEAMPVVILEAFAYKTPVVATAVGGVPELVKDGETGWLVPPRDPHALAQAIREALSNPEEARRRAENAYRHLLANFTVEKQAEAWERALQAAMENWRRRNA